MPPSLSSHAAKSRGVDPQTRTLRELCAGHGLAATHQRQVLYQVMQTMPGHPTPEEIYEQVKKRVPALN
jgi:Fur family peroxide stress response transcriptional regulator